MSVIKLAKEAESWFEKKTRDNGEEFFCLKDGHPEWIKDMAYKAHEEDSLAPKDYRHKFVWESLVNISECDEDNLEEMLDCYCDIDADIYSSDLLKWLSSHLTRPGWVDQAKEELGPGFTLMSEIMHGQLLEKQMVFGVVVKFLREMEEE